MISTSEDSLPLTSVARAVPVQLAFPFMLCLWDYHINLRDLITMLYRVGCCRAMDQVIPSLLPSN